MDRISRREQLRQTFDEVAEDYQDARPEYPDPKIEASGLFTDVTTRRFDWEIRYSAEGYIRLLETFSSNLTMEPWQRDQLYGEIRRRLALRPDGKLRRHWGVVLHVALRA